MQKRKASHMLLLLYVWGGGKTGGFDKKSRQACDDIAYHWHTKRYYLPDKKYIILITGTEELQNQAEKYIVEERGVPRDSVFLTEPSGTLRGQTVAAWKYIMKHEELFLDIELDDRLQQYKYVLPCAGAVSSHIPFMRAYEEWRTESGMVQDTYSTEDGVRFFENSRLWFLFIELGRDMKERNWRNLRAAIKSGGRWSLR